MLLILLRLCLLLPWTVAAPLKEPNELTQDDGVERDGMHSHTSLNTSRDERFIIQGGDINIPGSIASSGDNSEINIGSISTSVVSQEQQHKELDSEELGSEVKGLEQEKQFLCKFNDEQLAASRDQSGELTPHLINVEFQWKEENNVIPYYFTSVSSKDKEMFRSVMDIIEERTCFKFEEKNKDEYESKHCLEIITESKSCAIGCHGKVALSNTHDRLKLISETQVSDKEDCELQCKGFVLHELMHVLGVGHTFRRSDRDDYITVNETNIDSLGISLEYFAKCKDCILYPDIPYDCDSIMHYGTHCNSTEIMMPKNPNTCNLKKEAKLFDGPIASDLDWELLNIIGKCTGVDDGVADTAGVGEKDPPGMASQTVRDGVTGKSNRDATSRLEASLRFLRHHLKELPERNFNSDEKLLLIKMGEAKMYLEENCANENGNCDSLKITSYADEWLSILQKMIVDGELTSGYMESFEEYSTVLEAAVKAAQNVNKQTQQTIKECNPNDEESCSCGAENCTGGQICEAGKCLDVCEIKNKALTADCFCLHSEGLEFCPKGEGRNICSDHGCLLNVLPFFFLIFG